MKRRIAQAWKKLWSLKHILMDEHQRTSLKAGILETCVIPIPTYRCQTWSLSHRLKQMIQVCQRKLERKITHVTLRDRVRCEDLRRSTGKRDAFNLAERLKWKCSGHVARMDNNRWKHKLTMWDPREGWMNVGATTDEMGWPAQKTCGRTMVQKCERQSVVERTCKNVNSIGLAHL